MMPFSSRCPNEHPKHHSWLWPLRLPQVHGGGQYRTLRASRSPKNNGGNRSRRRPLRSRPQQFHSVYGQTARRSFNSQDWGPVMTSTQNTAGACFTQSSPAVYACHGRFFPVGNSPALRRRGLLGTFATPSARSQAGGKHIFGKLKFGQPRRRNGASSGEGAGFQVAS